MRPLRGVVVLASGAIAVALLVAGAPDAGANNPRWIKANFHAHGQRDLVYDDGRLAPADLHQVYARAGYDLSIHSAHTMSRAFTAADWATQRAQEAGTIGSTRTALGQEVTVANGPRFWGGLNIGSLRSIAKNNNHMGAFGHDQAVGHGLSVAAAADAAHAAGAATTVNHPGPGPGMWEWGYWDLPGNREKFDAIEVYNGYLLSVVGYFGFGTFEGVYRRATSPQGYDLKLAVSAGTDAHGDKAHRSTGCWVLAASNDPLDVAQAVKERKTVAITGHGFQSLRIVSVAHLGEVIQAGQADLGIELDRKVRKVVLWKNGAKVKTWRRTKSVRHRVTTSAKACYVWTATGDFLGRDRLMTSGIWLEP